MIRTLDQALAEITRLNRIVRDQADELAEWRRRVSVATRDVDPLGRLHIERDAFGLTRSEHQVLKAMVAAAPRTLTKEQLFDARHSPGDHEDAEIKIVDVYIFKLRRKMAAHGVVDAIGTSWGIGYFATAEGAAAIRGVWEDAWLRASSTKRRTA